MFRRQLLQGVAGSIAGIKGSEFIRLRGDDSDGIDHHPPPPDASVTSVAPHSPPLITGPQQVHHTDWVRHQFGWRTVAEETREDLVRMREAATYEITIDGEPVAAPEAHWQSIEPFDEEHWRLTWRITTPPREPGDHEFSLRVRFDEPVVCQAEDGSRKVWDGVEERTGTYTVIRPPSER